MNWGLEHQLSSAALWVDSALDAVDADVVHGAQDHLAGVVAGALGAELDGDFYQSIVQVNTW